MGKPCVLLICLAVVLARPSVPCAKEENWPQWRGPNRDGISPDRGLPKRWPKNGPRPAWKASGIGIGYSSAVLWNKTVYITGDIGDDLIITAFGARKGKKKWTTRHDKAWDGGENGNGIIKAFLNGFKNHVNPSGRGYLILSSLNNREQIFDPFINDLIFEEKLSEKYFYESLTTYCLRLKV